MAILKINGAYQSSGSAKTSGVLDGSLAKISGVATWNPAIVSNLAFWGKYNTNIATELWQDSSVAENNLAQAEATNAPTLTDPAGGLVFNGSDQWMDFGSSIDITANHNLYVGVIIHLSATNNECLLSDSNNEFLEFQTNKLIRLKTDTSNTTTTHTMTSSTWGTAGAFVFSTLRNDSSTGTWKIYKDGALITPNSWTNETNPGHMHFANVGARNDNDRFFGGTLYEMIIYDKGSDTLTAQEILDLNAYLVKKKIWIAT